MIQQVVFAPESAYALLEAGYVESTSKLVDPCMPSGAQLWQVNIFQPQGRCTFTADVQLPVAAGPQAQGSLASQASLAARVARRSLAAFINSEIPRN